MSNLAAYPGIVGSQENLDHINSMLIVAKRACLDKLVANFCSSQDAGDFLFELWIANVLLANKAVQNLVYEPKDMEKSPDFRLSIDGVCFDMQVKQLHQLANEDARALLEQEIKARLGRLPKPWLLNYWVADLFERHHVNKFIEYIERNYQGFQPGADGGASDDPYRYAWSDNGSPLIRFSFIKMKTGELGIHTGVYCCMGTDSDELAEIDIDTIRKKFQNRLKKSSDTFCYPVSHSQSNLVVVGAIPDVWMDDHTMCDVLYGQLQVNYRRGKDGRWHPSPGRAPGGLFNGKRFAKISGVILVSNRITLFDSRLSGVYFLNPMHLHLIADQPKPFEGVDYAILPEWKNSGYLELMPNG